jgi:hypothetical protein
MVEETNENNQPQAEDLSNWSFAEESEVLEAQQSQEIDTEQTFDTETAEGESYEGSSEEETQNENVEEYGQEEVEGAVLDYLSERLGYEVNSIDDLLEVEQKQAELDERVEVIMDFVEETGRDPQDWFIYQQLNPSEMDDSTAIQVQLSSDYPNLSQDEVITLMNNKYKLDPDLHSEEEVKVSHLQLKIDAQNARVSIDELREQYAMPEQQEQDFESSFDDDWYEAMEHETEALEGVEFDLGNGQRFTFGLNDNYRSELIEKNTRLDEFFDPYVQRDGNWDYDKLNVHRAVIDNMEQIVQSVYKQGMSDGQRGIVDQAANVSIPTPNQGGQPQENALEQQLLKALGGDNSWSFKL